jgi:hypothetical protein
MSELRAAVPERQRFSLAAVQSRRMFESDSSHETMEVRCRLWCDYCVCHLRNPPH